MKFFRKLAIKEALPKVAKGIMKVADTALLGGAVENLTENTKENPTGQIDYSKLIRTVLASTIPVILLIALFAGWIDLEQLKELLKLF